MGTLLAICGGKDGVGKTTFALNLAYGIHRNARKSVCFVEADAGNFGDIEVLLNAKNARAFTDFVNQVARMDPKLAQNWVGRHPTGLSVMRAAQFVQDFQSLDDKSIIKALQILKRAYDLVVIDVGREFNPLSFRALEAADQIYVVTDADILSVNQTSEYVKKLRSLHFGNEQLKLVINKFDPKGVVSPQVLRQKFNLEARILIPNDPQALQQMIAAAKPLQALGSKSNYLRGLDEALRSVGPLLQVQGKSRVGRPPKTQGLDILKQVLPFTYGGADVYEDVPAKGSTPDNIKERNLSVRARVHRRLLELVDLKEMDAIALEHDPKKKEELKSKTVQAVHQLLEEEGKEIQDRNERSQIAKEILDEALSLGPVEPLLLNPTVTEIMINGHDKIFVEQKGKITLSDYYFTSEKHLLGCIERILMPIGRRVDEKTPLADGRLRDGSRINVVIPPLALTGPTLTIRKFFKEKLTVGDLVKFGSLTDPMGDFLRAAVQAKLNIIVSGGTGSGKTTLLNLVSGFIPNDERIVTVEDAAELQLPQEHVITLESKPPNLEGEGAIGIRELVRNSLRMRPDRIVVGECRGGEALDMLQAMNTGHDGSLTTIHANNPKDCLRRIETLVMMAGFDLPIIAIREQVASAVNLIVQLRRMSDGSRRISHIEEVTGIEGDTIVTQNIFKFKQTGTDAQGKVQGSFQASGLVPKFVETLKSKGIALPKGLFGATPVPAQAQESAGAIPSKGSEAKSVGTPTRRPPGQSGAPSSSPSGSSRPGSAKKISVRNPHGGPKRR